MYRQSTHVYLPTFTSIHTLRPVTPSTFPFIPLQINMLYQYYLDIAYIFGEGNGTPLQYSCLQKSPGRRSLVGCSPWGCWGSDTTERLPFHFSLSCIGEGNGNPLQCSCLENPREQGSLVGWRLWGHTESDTTEVTQQQQHHYMYTWLFIDINSNNHNYSWYRALKCYC